MIKLIEREVTEMGPHRNTTVEQNGRNQETRGPHRQQIEDIIDGTEKQKKKDKTERERTTTAAKHIKPYLLTPLSIL